MPMIDASMKRVMRQLDIVGEIPVDALLEGAQVIYDRSQELVPVDTGFLKKSGFIQVQGDDVQIGYGADYASFVEFGTSRMEAQPYLRPAIDDNLTEIRDAVGAAVQDYMVDALNGRRGGSTISTQGNPFELQP